MRYKDHVNKWLGCEGCDLCHSRKNMVFARGQVPCDVLLIGEAPGDSEDVSGVPFKGPAGDLLNKIIAVAMPLDPQADALGAPDPQALSLCFTNLVCCIPKENGSKSEDGPPDESVEACSERLREFVKIADPKLIVCVGTCSRDWLDPKRKGHLTFHREIPTIDIVHPAAILRAVSAQKGLIRKKAVVTLTAAFEKLVKELQC